ncbi:hypothetical protein G6F31_012402 [Rhizopus arrhizus]|nr:hypothetical protein G6F31_012402 [Rhizopus arrhizus]
MYRVYPVATNDFGEDIGRTDVCWLEDPTKPVLVPLVKILGDVYSYKRYVAKSVEVSSVEDLEEIPQLTTEMQIVQFLNYAFVPVASIEDSAYEEKDISMKHVLGIANLYTEMMVDKTVQSFSTWCKKKDILMLNAPFTRKRRVVNGEISNNRIRRIYVLKEYLGGIVKGIVDFIPNYQKHIKSLKEQRFSIIGYARKSPGNEEERRESNSFKKW